MIALAVKGFRQVIGGDPVPVEDERVDVARGAVARAGVVEAHGTSRVPAVRS